MIPAEVLMPDAEAVPVRVTLGGAFQPIDGRFHWYGRIAATDVPGLHSPSPQRRDPPPKDRMAPLTRKYVSPSASP